MKDIEGFLKEEAEYAEAHMDAPEKPGTLALRPGLAKGKVFSIRLSEAEVAALEKTAGEVGVPASTLARSWITERLAAKAI